MNIFIRFEDIRRRTLKSSEIWPNFACFWPLKFFWGVPPKILDIIKYYKIIIKLLNYKIRHYKIVPITDHRAKFQAGRPTHLRDLALTKNIKKLEIWGKAQRESSRRPKSDWGKLRGVKRGENFPSIKVTWPELKCIGILKALCRLRVGQH